MSCALLGLLRGDDSHVYSALALAVALEKFKGPGEGLTAKGGPGIGPDQGNCGRASPLSMPPGGRIRALPSISLLWY